MGTCQSGRACNAADIWPPVSSPSTAIPFLVQVPRCVALVRQPWHSAATATVNARVCSHLDAPAMASESLADLGNPGSRCPETEVQVHCQMAGQALWSLSLRTANLFGRSQLLSGRESWLGLMTAVLVCHILWVEVRDRETGGPKLHPHLSAPAGPWGRGYWFHGSGCGYHNSILTSSPWLHF
jgi:hypothetical protein